MFALSAYRDKAKPSRPNGNLLNLYNTTNPYDTKELKAQAFGGAFADIGMNHKSFFLY